MTLIRRLLARWRGTGRPARRRHADLRALLSLDDRTLADIGLRRADVAAVVSGGVPPSHLGIRAPGALPPPTERAPVGHPAPPRWAAAT